MTSTELLFCPLLSFVFDTQRVDPKKKNSKYEQPDIHAVAVANIRAVVVTCIHAVAEADICEVTVA